MMVFLNYLWRLWFVLLAFVLAILIGPLVYLLANKPAYQKFWYGCVRAWCLGVFYGMGLRYRLHNPGRVNIAAGQQYVIVANHTSIMDIMLMVILHPQLPLFFVGKKEIEKIPIFGQVYKQFCVSVDRSSIKSRHAVYDACAQKMALGKSLVIFPEGGIPAEDVVLDGFKDGAFRIASGQYQLLCYSFANIKQIIPYAANRGRWGRVEVYLEACWPPTLSAQEMKEKSYDLIKNRLMA
jgi:1-acyl-sn-glycerol-3-phosphate acyltransferase